MTLNGRDHYDGSKASRIEYERLIGEWLAAERRALGITGYNHDPADSNPIK